MSVNLNSKEFLARLLAVENLDVVHQNVQSASFNVKDRVLTLPMWENMDSDTYDHLVGHEVGHALYTPSEDWRKNAEDLGPGFQSFMNVIEDARIEKLIQRKYPGLRRSFTKSYKKMLADGFFGGDVEKINTMRLIDRLNVYFKCGRTAGISFEEKELSWVDEINNVETFAQVVDIAKRLYAYEKETQQKNKEEFGQSDESEDGDSESNEGFDGDYGDDSDEESIYESYGDLEESDEGEEIADEIKSTAGGGNESDDVMSETDNSFNQKLKEEYSNIAGKKIYNIFMNYDFDLNDFIVKQNDVLGIMKSVDRVADQIKNELYREFKKNNTKTINYLVKEFEMKKSADLYSRTSIASTGVLDSIKMNSYRYNDDVFRKMSVLPQGKNHGMILYLDWSGSMQNDLKSTVDQLLNLVMFCRQVNIPFVVYAFTSLKNVPTTLPLTDKDANTFGIDRKARLFEFFNSKMNATKFSEMAKNLLSIADSLANRRIYSTDLGMLRMCSTPLDTVFVLATKVFDQFKKNNRVDIVNTIVLTDGESNPSDVYLKYSDIYNRIPQEGDYVMSTGVYSVANSNTISRIVDPVSKKQYRIQYNTYDSLGTEVTKILTQIYQDYTKSNAIGFRIINPNKREFFGELKRYISDSEKINAMHAEIKKEKFVVIPNSGYKSYFALGGGRMLDVANGSFEVADDASKRQIMTAYKKGSQSKQTSRILLSKFIDLVA